MSTPLVPAGDADEPQLAELRRKVAANPGDARAHFDLGNLLLQRDRVGEAVEPLTRAAELAPRVAAAHFGLAGALYRLNRFDEAVDAYRRADALDPDAPTANNLGNALSRAGRLDEAIAMYRRAADAVPQHFHYRLNLGRALKDAGRLVESAGHYVLAAELNADDPRIYAALGEINLARGQLTEAQFCWAKALELDASDYAVHRRLVHSLLYDPGATNAQMLTESRYWAQVHTSGIEPLTQRSADDAERRLRIGYLAGNLANRPEWQLLEAVVAGHDRTRFDVRCYADSRDAGPAAMQSAVDAADVWLDTSDLSHAELSRRIRDDGIDVLIDAAGHAQGRRMHVTAAKPAPVSIAWLGHAATTGLTTIDALLADDFLVPVDDEAFYTEQIHRLDGPTFALVARPHASDEVGPLPAALSGRPAFGAVCELAKIGPGVVQLWSAVLQEVPEATLIIRAATFGDAAICQGFVASFAEHAVTEDRLRLEEVKPTDDAATLYRDIDVALDPFPYDAGLGTLEALWMGVPVVHLRGKRLAGRRSESLLHYAGLGDFVVDTREQYVAKAVEAVRDVAAAAALRSRLRTKLSRSPLGDAAGLVRRLQDAYRAVWRQHCTTPAADV